MRILVWLFFIISPSVAMAEVNCEYVNDAKGCLACNIYHEARGETVAGMLAVALVTQNRVNDPRYPNNVCEVVWQKTWIKERNIWVGQFSWTVDGKSDKVLEENSWQWAVNISDTVLNKNRIENGISVHGVNRAVLWYHASSVRPYWSKVFKRTSCLGNHCFYQE